MVSSSEKRVRAHGMGNSAADNEGMHVPRIDVRSSVLLYFKESKTISFKWCTRTYNFCMYLQNIMLVKIIQNHWKYVLTLQHFIPLISESFARAQPLTFTREVTFWSAKLVPTPPTFGLFSSYVLAVLIRRQLL